MRKILLVTAIISIICGSVAGFDGKRKGFVLGGGIGFSPYIHWAFDDYASKDEGAGIGLQIIIGYAWDDRNMIVYEEQASGYSEGGGSIVQGGRFVSWHHYFGPAGRTFFTTAGLGLYTWATGSDDFNDSGAALLVGGGYEFHRHWQVGLFMSTGKSSRGSYGGMTHTTVDLMIGGVAF